MGHSITISGPRMRGRVRAPAALAAVLAAVSPCASPAAAAGPQWTPAAWSDTDTLEILTTGPEEGEHWSKLWLVVIDDEVYVRLGSRATERVHRNTTAPHVSVRIAGQRFDGVRLEHAPELRERVAAAMAAKYRSDILIRLFPHPMTARLVAPAPSPMSDRP